MSKAELITWLATLPDNSPDLARVDTIRRGADQAEPEEAWLSLKEVSEKVRKHVVWLAKLRVPEVCGERLAGRRSYKLSRVLDYLKSEDCRARIAELNEQRRKQEQAKKGATL